MSKFVYLINDLPYGYEKYQAEAAKEGGALLSRNFTSVFQKVLYKAHLSWKVNQIISLPFKTLWFNYFLDGNKLGTNERIYFLIDEKFHITEYRDGLVYLKNRFPNSKLIFIFSNPPGEDNFFKLVHLQDLFDYMITDIQSAAQKYGYLYYPINPYKLPDLDNKSPENDVFFVGANKGRLDQLLRIYELLSSAGLKCDFYITGVRKEEMKYADRIHYNKWINYDEVLKKISNSKAVLEVVQDDLDYYTFRVYEAMLLHKKLLTTNQGIRNSKLFDPEIIHIIDLKIENAAAVKDFIVQKVDSNLYPDKDLWSFKRFADFIEQIDRGTENGNTGTETKISH